jgi:predicted Holliday junction resolvase-like endonuclease
MSEQKAIIFVVGAVVVLFFFKLLLPVLRSCIWVLFRFDKEVKKVRSEQKSSQVRLGKISETLAPFLDTFPVDVHKKGTTTIFLGQPIDYIHFDPDEGVTFIEVKSGDAKLNGVQRAIRDCIKEGKISWQQVRIKGEENT